MLQYCNFSQNEIQYIAEVNEDKFGKFTPGSKFQQSQSDANKQPDYYLVYHGTLEIAF